MNRVCNIAWIRFSLQSIRRSLPRAARRAAKGPTSPSTPLAHFGSKSLMLLMVEIFGVAYCHSKQNPDEAPISSSVTWYFRCCTFCQQPSKFRAFFYFRESFNIIHTLKFVHFIIIIICVRVRAVAGGGQEDQPVPLRPGQLHTRPLTGQPRPACVHALSQPGGGGGPWGARRAPGVGGGAGTDPVGRIGPAQRLRRGAAPRPAQRGEGGRSAKSEAGAREGSLLGEQGH